MNIDDLVEKVVCEIQGTCRTLDSVLEDNDAIDQFDNSDFLELLDQEIFECSICGWWCEISEDVSEDYGLEELACGDCCD